MTEESNSYPMILGTIQTLVNTASAESKRGQPIMLESTLKKAEK